VQGDDPEEPSLGSAERQRIDLDPDLEQEEHDADVREDLQLLPVRHVPGRERLNQEPDPEIRDHGRQPEPPHRPTGGDGQEQDDPDLEDDRRAGVHPTETPTERSSSPP
jgi:hypothetical protein